MRQYVYSDGILELVATGKVNGPDQVGGLKCGTRNYARLNSGPWLYVTCRTMHSIWTLCEAAENGAEAIEAITAEY